MTVTRTLKIKDGDRNRKLGNEKRMDGRVEYSSRMVRWMVQ